jgi:hypothetical protein
MTDETKRIGDARRFGERRSVMMVVVDDGSWDGVVAGIGVRVVGDMVDLFDAAV